MMLSGMRGVMDDAISIYFADATLASAFVVRWCVGSKVDTAGGVFPVRQDEPSPRVGAGCIGRREPTRPTGVAAFENVFGVVIIGTEIRGLSSCSSGTSPKAPGGSDDAVVERAPRRHDRPA